MAAALLMAAAGCGGDEDRDARPLTALQRTSPPPRDPAVVPGTGTLTAYVRRAKLLRSRPGGRVLARMRRRTRFGTPRVVTALERRGRWLGVLAEELPNHRVGWIDGAAGVSLYRVPWSLQVDLSKRRLTVLRDGRVVTRTAVAIGRPIAPTPPGRYAVTDKLVGGNAGGPYGCCVLALTGHQPRTPQGWGGGDRLAIHATPAEQTIGQAASLGCLRASNSVMRRLVRRVPLGTRVYIRP